MPRIELTHEEARMLTEVLESALSDLRMEIADTDSWDFREGLKAQKAVLVQVLESIREPALAG